MTNTNLRILFYQLILFLLFPHSVDLSFSPSTVTTSLSSSDFSSLFSKFSLHLSSSHSTKSHLLPFSSLLLTSPLSSFLLPFFSSLFITAYLSFTSLLFSYLFFTLLTPLLFSPPISHLFSHSSSLLFSSLLPSPL